MCIEMLMYANDTTLYCKLDQNSTSDSVPVLKLKFITYWLDANYWKTKHI